MNTELSWVHIAFMICYIVPGFAMIAVYYIGVHYTEKSKEKKFEESKLQRVYHNIGGFLQTFGLLIIFICAAIFVPV